MNKFIEYWKKYNREIKVGALAMISIFLLFYGFNFLKGVNIFHPSNSYLGVFAEIPGLEEQSPVYIHGYKVGQVEEINYNFTLDSAFVVEVAINRDISLPEGTSMVIIADGLLAGKAIELRFPAQIANQQSPISNQQSAIINQIPHGSYLPTAIQPSLIETLENQLLANINAAVSDVDSLVNDLHAQLEGDHLKAAIANVEQITDELTGVSAELRYMMGHQIPRIVDNADTTIANLNAIIADVKSADLAATVARVDTTLDSVNALISDVRSPDGTIGKLLYDPSLYTDIDATVVSADSLITDLKANPKRYVHFSLFGQREKKKK